MSREPYRLTFALGDMRGGANLSGQQLEVLLRALVRVNVIRTKKDPGAVKAASGVSLVSYPTGWRPPGEEEWSDAASVVRRGTASNTDLICAKAADLELQGVSVRVIPELRGDMWRAVLVAPSGPATTGGWLPLLDRMRITFVLDLFNGQKQPHSLTAPTLDALLDGLTEIDANFLRAHPETPTMAELRNHLLYMEEPIGQEDWQDVPTCIRMQRSDCEDLSCWRAAESIVRDGVPAKAIASKHELPNGGTLYHITTKIFGDRPRTEDLSRVQGMR